MASIPVAAVTYKKIINVLPILQILKSCANAQLKGGRGFCSFHSPKQNTVGCEHYSVHCRVYIWLGAAISHRVDSVLYNQLPSAVSSHGPFSPTVLLPAVYRWRVWKLKSLYDVCGLKLTDPN
jgi:hypothetical protein